MPSTAAPRAPAATPSTVALVAAFAAVYLIWGSTYLAIRFAIETLPPLLMAAVRFLTAGSFLYAWGRWRDGPPPTSRQWRDATVSGVLLLVGGNGAVVLAEQWIPSGLTALLVGSVPLWMVVLDAAWGSGGRPPRRAVAGLLAGFAGLALLVGSPGAGAGGARELVGVAVVLAGSVSWAAGSIWTRRTPAPPRPLRRVGMQMLAGGLGLLLVALAAGEAAGFDPGAVSARSAWALGYLVVFGAVVGYSAYIWLLGVTTPARAGTYAYVNPVVALALGAWLADEPLSFRSLLAAAIIVGSVIVITTARERPRGTAA